MNQTETERTRSIPALPDEINGTPVVRWSTWKAVPLISHIDPACETCADPGPGCIAWGYARATYRGKGMERRRWTAHRCPACDEMRVYERRTDPGTLRLISTQVLYGPPRTHTAHLIPAQEPD